jgi:hypothetical protein
MAQTRLDLPFLQGISLVLGTSDNSEGGLIDVDVSGQFFPDAPPNLDLYLRTTALSLDLDRALFKPVDVTRSRVSSRLRQKKATSVFRSSPFFIWVTRTKSGC